jgi:hypothetical protein
MATILVPVRRFSVVSAHPFGEVVERLMATIGRPDMAAFRTALASATTGAEIERLVARAAGSSDLMEFTRFDAGAVLRKMAGGHGSQALRIVIGNPVVMREMARHVPDAASYAPVTILVDERNDGVHLSYDSMESCLAPYGSPAASAVARQLDTKVEALMAGAAR